MKRTIALAISSILVALAAPAYAETQNFDFSGFTEVSVSAGVSANIEVGGDFSVRAEGSENDLEKLEIELKGDTLKIGRKTGLRSVFRSSDITVFVSMPSISGIGASSGAEATASGVDASEFSASASSGAELEASGSCGSLSASASSGAELDLSGLTCTDVDARASSGADMSVFASASIKARASSGGQIDVEGDPANRDVSKSSGGDVDF